MKTAEMPQVSLTATFRELQSARAATQRLRQAGVAPGSIHFQAGEPAQREAGFLARFVLIVALWSVAGTAVGAALGAMLSYTVGPHGTDGLILLAISFAVFAHVLAGMWAGYVLLADRTEREVLRGSGGQVTVVIDREQALQVTDVLRRAGAIEVRTNSGD
jgi:hypothetical protein